MKCLFFFHLSLFSCSLVQPPFTSVDHSERKLRQFVTEFVTTRLDARELLFSGGDISINLIDYNVTKVTYYVDCFISNECQIPNFRRTKNGAYTG